MGIQKESKYDNRDSGLQNNNTGTGRQENRTASGENINHGADQNVNYGGNHSNQSNNESQVHNYTIDPQPASEQSNETPIATRTSAHPALSQMTWDELYVHHLYGTKRNFHPLPKPCPSRDMCGKYVNATGIRIGDVGIFKYHVPFKTLFNLNDTKDNSLNKRFTVPNDVESLPKLDSYVDVISQNRELIVRPTSGIEFSDVLGTGSNSTARYFDVNSTSGALLLLPRGSSLYSLAGHRTRLEECIRRDYCKWFALAEQHEGQDFDRRTLCVATDVVKCSAWAIATWNEIPLEGPTVTLKLTEEEDRYAWESFTPNCGVSCHPEIIPPTLWSRILPSWDSPCNQDVFVRGYWITGEDTISMMPPHPPPDPQSNAQYGDSGYSSSIDAESIPTREYPPEGQNGESTGGRGPTNHDAHRNPDTTSRSGGSGQDHNSDRDSRHQFTDATGEPQLIPVDRDCLPLSGPIHNPCEAINRFILALLRTIGLESGELNDPPNCAISHDDDWIDIVEEPSTRGATVLLDQSSFLRQVSSKVKFIVEKDVVYTRDLHDDEKGLINHYTGGSGWRDSIPVYLEFRYNQGWPTRLPDPQLSCGSHAAAEAAVDVDFPKLVKELTALIKGHVYPRDDSNFFEYTAMFNGNVQSPAKAVTCPLDAEDISKIVLFCRKHSFSLSIKAGGFGTAGWAVGGDIVIDLGRLVEVDIELPKEDGSYTGLRDIPTAHSKGKRPITDVDTKPSNSSPGKRRREEDNDLRNYDLASPSAAAFLRGKSSSSDHSPHVIRRRISEHTYVTGPSSYTSEANGSGNSDGQSSSSSSSTVTSRASSSNGSSQTPRAPVTTNSGAPINADLFGYLDGPTKDIPTMQSNFARPDAFNPPVQGPGPSTIVPNPNLPASTSRSMPSQSRALHPHAYVTFGAGKRQKEIDIFTSRNPLPGRSVLGEDDRIPYHIPSGAHPAGSSIMLLGGFGFLSRLHGLSIDNLVEVEVVLADGRIVVANENEYPDLFWALRGAGPAFGVATRYKVKAYPVPVVFAGNLIYRFHRSTAPSLIKHFRDCVKGAPRELYANVFLTAGPPGKDSLVVIQMCYVGPKERGQEYLLALASWEGDKNLLNDVHEKSFLHQQDSVAQVLRGKAGRQWFIRSALITSLSDEIIDRTVSQFADTPEGCTWLFELAGGAIADYEDTCVPKTQREATFTVAALHQWDMGINDLRCITTAEEWIADTLKPVQTGGPLPSFLGRHESPTRTIACFGKNWDRLKELKGKYDPANVFRNSLWPLGADGEIVEPQTHEPLTPDAAGTSFDRLKDVKGKGKGV